MFKKVLGKIESANFKAAVSKGALTCPSCGGKPHGIPANASEILSCPACDTRASAGEWAATSQSDVRAGDSDRPPADTKITRGKDAVGASVWNIPASGKSGGLLFLAIFWCAITAIASGGFLFAFLSGEPIHDRGPVKSPDWVIIPFFSVFWSIGMGMFYAACRNKFAKHRLSVNASVVILRRELFGKVREKSLPVTDIKTVSQTEFYQQNHQPVLGIEIRSDRGKLRFGSILTAEEKAWLVADIRRAVHRYPVPGAVLRQVSEPQMLKQQVSEPQAFFSVILPDARKHLWPLAVMLALIGVVFVIIGDRLIDPVAAPTVIDAFDKVFNFLTQGFRTIWLVMSSCMAAAGISMIVWLMWTRGRERRIEGSDSEVSLRTYRHGLVLENRSFPRASVSDIRASVSGSSGNTVMKQLELIVGDRAEMVVSWIDGTRADVIVDEVRRALGTGGKP